MPRASESERHQLHRCVAPSEVPCILILVAKVLA